jgi:ubiquinone/menaquinone biosynthesis C-methylase UbiE
MNPFKREAMLDLMNQQVFDNLGLNENENDNLVYDLGCGLAAPSRAFAKRFPGKKIKGVTIVEWQIEKAKALNKAAGIDGNIELILGDYTKTNFLESSADAVYALESCCHANGLSKPDFVKEMLRVLKPGKRFVIVDGFIKRDPQKFRGLLKYCYNEICTGWALPSFPHAGLLVEEIKNNGGVEIEVKDLSLRIAPSAMHAPFTVVFFIVKKMLQGEKLNKVRIGHLKSCFLGLVLGMFRGSFSYLMVTGVKAN